MTITKLILKLLFVAFCAVFLSFAYGSANGDTETNNIWELLGRDFSLPYEDTNPYVEKHIRWFQRHPRHFQKILKKSQPFLSYVYQQTRNRSLPAELALIPIIESEYDPNSRARSGPAGLWQMMPGTANKYGLKINKWYDGRRDVTASTQAALNYLTYLHNYLDKDWLMALAAYQTGENKIKSLQASGKDFWQSRLANRSAIYLPKLLAIACIIKNPEHYNLALPSVNTNTKLREIHFDKPMDLFQAAKEIGVSVAVLSRYNPGIKHHKMNPDGPFTLLIPDENSNTNNFTSPENEFTSLTPKQTVKHTDKKLIKYTVKQGDTLAKIAKRWHISAKTLQEKNHIKNAKHLKLGQKIIVLERWSE